MSSHDLSPALRARLRVRRMALDNPARAAAVAYAVLMVLGALLLWHPGFHEPGQSTPVRFIDAAFTSVSAVSTTGLSTIDTASTFTFGGELIVLLLLQIGGIGYLTLMSFVYLLLRARLSHVQRTLTTSSFGLTGGVDAGHFIRRVVAFTVIIEAMGAVVLAALFARAGVADPLWQGVFHAVSSFCTAGFSLFPNSLEDFKDQPLVLYAISILSYLGALGFVLLAEVVRRLSSERDHPLSLTTKLILLVSAGLLVAGTLFVWTFEPSLAALPADQRFHNALFQVMTASTTVGFNSVPIGSLAPASILVIYLLMFVGASPAGTGGGLKTTTAALLIANAAASLRGRTYVTTRGHRIPLARVQQAAGTLVIGLGIVFLALVLLDLTGDYRFDKALFEVVSAMGTVGLSMGLTGELNDAGKAIIIAVMYIGRVGILTFFVALVLAREDADQPSPSQDVML